MISGFYLGEMVRLALLDRKHELKSVAPAKLKAKDCISGADVSDFIE